MSAKNKLSKLCIEQVRDEAKTTDQAIAFIKKFMKLYEKCRPDKEYRTYLTHYEFFAWINEIREAFASEDYVKAAYKLVDTFYEQREVIYQSRVRSAILQLLQQYIKNEEMPI